MADQPQAAPVDGRDPVSAGIPAVFQQLVPQVPGNIQDIAQTTFPDDPIIHDGLDELPWYTDPDLVTGHPQALQEVTPVTWQVTVRKGDASQLLQDSAGRPLSVRLAVGLKRFAVTMRHMTSRKPTRTGFHVTFWGMHADIIEGSGTTGVFLNQLGLTDFYSTEPISEELQRLFGSGNMRSQNGEGEIFVATTGLEPGATNANVQNDFLTNMLLKRGVDPDTAFRVAAQDAFVELLSLFKMNGLVWFYNKNYQAGLTEQDETNLSVWSSKLGTSSTQANARNNDVKSRGSVIFNLKGNTYQGYFKALSWSQDAANPFQWNFNFVFQVERTLNLVYYPTGGQ